MRLFRTIAGVRTQLKPAWKTDQNLALVPTMGALHSGHLSLIEQAVTANDVVVVSIFVNPLQFEPSSDLEQYPRQLEQDCQLCEEVGVDIVFAPTVEELYPHTPSAQGTQTQEEMTRVIPPPAMTSQMCGHSRPGHFEGVATVVTKLLNIIQPTRAYFGQKDAQQLAIVRRLVADLNFPVEICACPIVREASGLAYSSRNQYLSSDEKKQAQGLYQGLQRAKQAFQEENIRTAEKLLLYLQENISGLQLDYTALVDPDTLQPLTSVNKKALLALAAYVGKTRLIDNMILRDRAPIIAIDGPAGAGKSTVTRQVAYQLGLLHLDTGAMYRGLTWLVLNSEIALDDEAGIAELVSQADLQLVLSSDPEIPVKVSVNGKDVTKAIRSSLVTRNVSVISAQKAVRDKLLEQQRQWGEKGGLVAEGRDLGTHVFPNAELKIFLTASVGERARRRQKELVTQGQENIDFEQLQQEIQQRDTYDSARAIAPLRKAPDAIELVTDGLTIEEVIAKIIHLYRDRFPIADSG
ncbi:pantothenate synthetase [Halothece sp. PCC 7418]|uniref:bifunctional pantoate--beta-alanine ligase/(d)CMP kinase n=1 Tax=Halothece sp. (strain PCC 7418) TaxID=65093 RepID=UPI0002A08979|nr:bifunctional pantoate--beta-alanine ligase/(d)CMP kinase [Halothece sp. PCC 7418]AFZ42408.1 pantothenate synthetase [Halothece sp. PCC 7418]